MGVTNPSQERMDKGEGGNAMKGAVSGGVSVSISFSTYVKLALKNGWPLLATIFIACLLIGNLNTESTWADASCWQSCLSSGVSEPPLSELANDQVSLQYIRKPLNEKPLYVILTITTAILIILNTALYLWEAEKKKSIQLAVAWILTFVSEIFTTLWVMKLFNGWDWGKFADEVVPLLIFIVFVFVDFINYREASIKRNLHDSYSCNEKGKNKEDEAIEQFALNQVLFVDIPVVIGVAFAIVLAVYLDRTFTELEHYLHAFFSGAIVMHLVVSQIIYFIIAFKKDLASRRVRCFA